MDGRDRRATSPGDSVVELIGVRKLYRQRQRSERLGDVLSNLFRPIVREVEERCASLGVRIVREGDLAVEPEDETS